MNTTEQQQLAGAGLAVFSGDYCGAEELVAVLQRATGLRPVGEGELTSAAVSLSGLVAVEIERAFSPKTSVFDKFTHEKGRALAWLRLALAEMLVEDSRLLLMGFPGLLVPREITHFLRVCLIAELSHRVRRLVGHEGVGDREARRRIAASDAAKGRWTATLFGREDPWDANLYDLLIPLHQTDASQAVELIGKQLAGKAVQPTVESRQAMDDFLLAARAAVALVRAGHDGEVKAAGGAITVSMRRKVLMFKQLKEEMQAILHALPGVSTVEVVGGNGRSGDIYHKHNIATPSKVLLVDDEREFVQTLSERVLFREVGTAVAYDGQSALEMLIDDEPDVLVLDLKMPGMDGIEVLRRVKKIRPDVEVIILTGHGSEEDRRVCMDLGALAYLHKPVDIELLSARLQEAHDLVRARRQK
jgi:CheY-like chemotaxis protein